MKVQYVDVTTKKMISKLGSAITIEGLSINKDGSEAFADWCHKLAKFKDKLPKCYVIKGKIMNTLYKLSGNRQYSNDLNIVCFDLNDFENPLAMTIPRFQIGARWLDDIIDNNRAQCA